MSHQSQGQCIFCNVGSCEHNERQKLCNLKDIQVSARPGCNTSQPDESMCSSYKCRGK